MASISPASDSAPRAADASGEPSRPVQVWPDAFAARYRAAGYWRNETFGAWLRERATAHPDRLAVIGGEQRWTYAELDRRASALAAGFLGAGLRQGDRVLVHLPNVPDFIAVVMGLFRAGLIPVYALPAHRITEIEHFARGSGARAYVAAAAHAGFDYTELARELQARQPRVEHVWIAAPAATAPAAATATATPAAAARPAAAAQGTAAAPAPADAFPRLDALYAADGAAVPASVSQGPDVAFLQISGGSTGLSKLIPRTHDDYIYTLRESARICGLDGDSVFLGALPIAHNFPMSSPGFLGTLYAGGRVVLCPSPDPESAFALVERERVTVTSLVPPLLLQWLDRAPASGRDLSSLRAIQVGGAKLSAEIARRVRPTLGATLQQVFGMAEGLVNYTRLDDPDELVIHTQGRPISPDDEILILDDEGRPVAPGQAGHLLTRGPYTIRAYHDNPSANARSFTEDGYYRTGDVVRMTPEGYLEVQGRAGDHINRAGEKISAEEIEDHLLSHPQVFDAAVVSVPDEYLGERSCAFVIPKGERPRPADLKRWIRARGIADFKVPDQIVFVDRFASTAALKISRKALRAQLRAQLLEQESQERAAQ
ncbi:Long-chain-fatty-acid--CoA ligase [Castellaniella defragrans 65Phen]|uniref:Long-chain-fatty-acid--CoA ligase n=1 Tax=Castellaniella defragrans (strain DSM 12143 / CCUG 39792 / 65Phen) TaxID=1437824 RepID=W8WZT6_CASD6|nr:AMP-binding protein [Castellaniella defragrans]CDM22537.1 Long-chain-fatty-acid--CoA ligase [Castellaniella defragrans 65Phen]